MAKRINITSRYLKNWLEQKFKELEINHPVIECHATRCTENQYQNGAAYYVLSIGDSSCTCSIFVFYGRQYLNQQLNAGYELFLRLKNNRFPLLVDAEIDIRKKK